MLHSQLHQRQQHAFNGFVAEEFFDRVSFFSQDHLHQVDQNVYYEGLKLLFFAVTAVSTSQVVSSPKHRTHYLHVGTEHIDQLFFVPDTGFNFFLLQLMRLVFLFEFLQFLDHWLAANFEETSELVEQWKEAFWEKGQQGFRVVDGDEFEQNLDKL